MKTLIVIFLTGILTNLFGQLDSFKIQTLPIHYLISNEIHGQELIDTTKWFHDFEVDYYPNIKNCQVNKGIGYLDSSGSAFKESLERTLKVCTGKDYILIRFSGLYMSQAGMEPKTMKENPSFYLNIFASGAIHSIVIRNLDNNEEVENCLKSILTSCQLNPAILNKQAVKSSWTFTIHRL